MSTAPELSPAEAARVAAFDAAPVLDEAVLAQVAVALELACGDDATWMTLVAAAIAADPSPAEEAVTDDWLYNEASGALYGPTDSPHLRRIVATEVEPEFGHLIANTMNRAALAPPAPAPQGEDEAPRERIAREVARAFGNDWERCTDAMRALYRADADRALTGEPR